MWIFFIFIHIDMHADVPVIYACRSRLSTLSTVSTGYVNICLFCICGRARDLLFSLDMLQYKYLAGDAAHGDLPCRRNTYKTGELP